MPTVDESELETAEELLPFYVYELSDPVDDKVFYVGEGEKDRVLQHGRELDYDKDYEEGVLSPKNAKLVDIAAAGRLVRRLIVGRYRTKDEARAVEATLINWVYGSKNLTNLNRGHHSEAIRPKGVMEEIAGIDIERKPRVHDGAHTKRSIDRLMASEAPAMFKQFQSVLGAAGFTVRGFDAVPRERWLDPGIGNGQMACLVTVGDIDCLLLVSADSKYTKIQVANTERTKRFGLKRLQGMGAIPVNFVKEAPRYMHLPERWEWADSVTPETITGILETLIAELAQPPTGDATR